jgi:hypothetical protein
VTGIAALLGVGGPDIPDNATNLRLGTVVTTPGFTVCTVRIDGAVTTVSAGFYESSGGFPLVGDRVIVGLIGKSLYVIANLSYGYGNLGGVAATTGAFSTSGAPNGTTGVSFNIARSGTYLFRNTATGFSASGANLATSTCYIDGTSRVAYSFLINTPSQHQFLGVGEFTLFVFSGTHWWWQQLTGTNITSDANDRGTLSWSRI